MSIDPEITDSLRQIARTAGQFGHRQHIQLAFLAVRRHGMPAATDQICVAIRQFASYQKAPQKYHYTVSRAWTELVAHHVAADPGCADFEAFATRNPALLDKRLLTRFYQSRTLAARQAHESWVPPDLAPFPWDAG